MPVNFLNNERHTIDFRKGIVRDRFDEPTYLTFSLDFTLDEKFQGYRQDDFLAVSPLFNQTEGKSQSAINYLLSRGENDKADQLAVFTNLMKYLRDDAPWYFQSVTGLDEIWKKATDMKDPMKGGEITVSTLEAVDLRITELADLYRNSIFDKQYMRERVPDNLRWFSMDIWVAEFRNLRNILPPLAPIGGGINVSGPNLGGVLGASNGIGNVLENFGYLRFRCRQCEFDFSDTFPGGNQMVIGGNNIETAKGSFKIKIGWMEEENKYSSGSNTFDNLTSAQVRGNKWNNNGTGIDPLDNLLGGTGLSGASLDSAGSFLSGLPGVGNKITSIGAKAASGVQSVLSTPNRLINQGIQELGQLIDQGRLGQANIYGYESNGDVIPDNTAVPKNKN